MYTIVSADGLRPLPPRPDLAYEEARARELQRAFNAPDPHTTGDSGSSTRDERSLEIARSRVAREYGFGSWEKLVEYYKTWELHERTGPRFKWDGLALYENRVSWLTNELRNRKAFAVQPPDIQGTGATLATYVPRLFGLTDAEIFRADVTEAEIRHAVARSERFSNWETLAAYATTHVRASRDDWNNTPQFEASKALKVGDRERAGQLFRAHPELLQSRDPRGVNGSILNDVVLRAIRKPTEESLATYRWVQSQGADFQHTLNELLLGSVRTPPEEVQNLLNLGANPNWVPNNGYSVLEHAVYRYWNGASVDLIAERVEPRQSFWLSAALGDVDTMLQFVDENGVPSEAARRDRPPFNALWMDAPNRPDAGDRDVVWEAFMLACMNNRAATIDALLQRGFPIDYSPHEMSMLRWAVGNWIPDVVETLIERGADPTYKIWPSVRSAREMAADWTAQDAASPIAQRIYSLCTR